jgi:hypothetical protein
VRIRYDFGADWTGDSSIFFRIVLTDAAAKQPGLGDLAQNISLTLEREVKPEQQGLKAYVNFRSLSEQTALNDPEWA